EMFGGGEALNQREVDELLERLTSRLGEKAILRPQLEPDAQPEFAYRYESWMKHDVSGDAASRLHGELRPLFLKNPPLPIAVVSIHPGGSPKKFQWNERDHIIERSWGPERIETGWWRGDDVRRDYYLVETSGGERFWVFRDATDDGWFLHGVFA